MEMLLKNKNAVIYGAGGAIGGAVAHAFAREGARVFLAGRTLAAIDAVAKEIIAAGGVAETVQVDALDERAVEEHVDAVVKKIGGSMSPSCFSKPAGVATYPARRGVPLRRTDLRLPAYPTADALPAPQS